MQSEVVTGVIGAGGRVAICAVSACVVFVFVSWPIRD